MRIFPGYNDDGTEGGGEEPGRQDEPVACNIKVELSKQDQTGGALTLGITGYHAAIMTHQSNQNFSMGFRAGPSILFTICLAIPMLTFIGGACNVKPTHATITEINQLLAKEIPLGSDKSQVIAILDAHQIQHSDYSNHPERESDVQDPKLDSKRRFIKGYVGSIVRDVGNEKWYFFSRQDIQMFFYFDERNALIAVNTTEVKTGF
jgi:hypothetical protein